MALPITEAGPLRPGLHRYCLQAVEHCGRGPDQLVPELKKPVAIHPGDELFRLLDAEACYKRDFANFNKPSNARKGMHEIPALISESLRPVRIVGELSRVPDSRTFQPRCV